MVLDQFLSFLDILYIYKWQLNRKWSSSSTVGSSVQNQQTLSSTGRGAGR